MLANHSAARALAHRPAPNRGSERGRGRGAQQTTRRRPSRSVGRVPPRCGRVPGGVRDALPPDKSCRHSTDVHQGRIWSAFSGLISCLIGRSHWLSSSSLGTPSRRLVSNPRLQPAAEAGVGRVGPWPLPPPLLATPLPFCFFFFFFFTPAPAGADPPDAAAPPCEGFPPLLLPRFPPPLDLELGDAGAAPPLVGDLEPPDCPAFSAAAARLGEEGASPDRADGGMSKIESTTGVPKVT